MGYLQYDMYGNLVKMKEPIPPSRKLKTMQELHGTIEGHICKECRHVVKIQYAGTYYKCKLWRMSHCTSSDIRLKNKACGKFESSEK